MRGRGTRKPPETWLSFPTVWAHASGNSRATSTSNVEGTRKDAREWEEIRVGDWEGGGEATLEGVLNGDVAVAGEEEPVGGEEAMVGEESRESAHVYMKLMPLSVMGMQYPIGSS